MPSKRAVAPRPHTEAKPPPSADPRVRAKEVPATTSRPPSERDSTPRSPPYRLSYRPVPSAPARASQSRSASAASREAALSAPAPEPGSAALPVPPSQDGSAWPASVARPPGARGAASRAATASTT